MKRRRICNECVCKPMCARFGATGGVHECEYYVKIVHCKDCENFGQCSIYDAGNFNRYDSCSKGKEKEK